MCGVQYLYQFILIQACFSWATDRVLFNFKKLSALSFFNAFWLKWGFYIKKQKLRKSQNMRTWYIQYKYTFLHKARKKRIMPTLLLSDDVGSNLKTWKNTRENNVETAGAGTVISVNIEAAMSAWWITNHYDLNRIYFINLSIS